jgi:hypothetical protein
MPEDNEISFSTVWKVATLNIRLKDDLNVPKRRRSISAFLSPGSSRRARKVALLEEPPDSFLLLLFFAVQLRG